MKKLLIVLAVFFWANMATAQQIQLKRWYFSPSNVDMTLPAPSVGSIGGASVAVTQIDNGAYDSYNPSGPPMFFIADNTVFDATGNAMSGLLLSTSIRTSEIAVVPATDNSPCTQNKYLIIYASYCLCPSFITNIFMNEVDMSGNNGLGTVSSPTTLMTLYRSEYVGIAIGHMNSATSTRNIYVVGGEPSPTGFQQTISKITIGNNNVTNVTNLLTTTTEDFSTSELDLNPDETMLAFATINNVNSSANRYHIFNIGGNLVSFSVGNANTTTEGRGVEFYKNANGQEKLMVGNGSDGLWVINPNNPTVGQV